jgi:hypothetical protein
VRKYSGTFSGLEAIKEDRSMNFIVDGSLLLQIISHVQLVRQ